MADIQMGILKPAYLAKAAQLESNSLLHAHMGAKASAMARHPAAAPARKTQFRAAADMHLGQQANNAGEHMALKPSKKSSMESRSANFSDNASMN